MSFRCVILEDEKPARELLKNFIGKIPSLVLVAEFKDPLQIDLTDWSTVDILFTDIEMGEISGLQFLRTLAKKPFVIITTAYSEHAIEGYELDIVDYLVKPFPFERFLTAINKVQSRISGAPSGSAQPEEPPMHIVADHKTYRIFPDDIIFIEGMREYVRYYLQTGEKLMELKALKSLEESLPAQFSRVHKSYIVNKNHVKAFDGVSIELSIQNIPIGKSYRSEAREFLLAN